MGVYVGSSFRIFATCIYQPSPGVTESTGWGGVDKTQDVDGAERKAGGSFLRGVVCVV